MDFITDDDALNEILLLNDLSRYLRVAFDRRADYLHLTRAQWRLLNLLRRNEGIRQVHLAAMMEIEPITLVRQLDRMEADGWIERRSDPGDRRANKIYTTQRIADIVAGVRHVALQLRHEFAEGFTKQEHRAFLDYLARMRDNAAKVAAEEPSDAGMGIFAQG
jgi:MarR family transcriptional regulator for hemolysin